MTETNDLSGKTFSSPKLSKEEQKKRIDGLWDDSVEPEKRSFDEIKIETIEAQKYIQKLHNRIDVDVDGMSMILKTISVLDWDTSSGDEANITQQTDLIYSCILSPKMTRAEFDTFPAAVKYKLHRFLLDDFFVIAGKTVLKD